MAQLSKEISVIIATYNGESCEEKDKATSNILSYYHKKNGVYEAAWCSTSYRWDKRSDEMECFVQIFLNHPVLLSL